MKSFAFPGIAAVAAVSCCLGLPLLIGATGLVAVAAWGAVIVVGAQAVYMQAGDGDIALAPYTTDGVGLLDGHVRHCVRDSLTGGPDGDEKVDELVAAVARFAGR